MTRPSPRTIAIATALAMATALGTGGWIWFHRQANHELVEALEDARAHLPSDVTLTWGKATAQPASHGARLTDVVLQEGDLTISAAALEIVGATLGPDRGTGVSPSAANSPLHCDHVVAYTLRVGSPHGQFEAHRMSLDGLTLPAPSDDQLAGLVLDHGELHDASLGVPVRRVTMAAKKLDLDQYGGGRFARVSGHGLTARSEAPVTRELAVSEAFLDGVDLASVFADELAGRVSAPRDGTRSFRMAGVLLKGQTVATDPALQPLMAVGKGHAYQSISNQKARMTISLDHVRLWPVLSFLQPFTHDRVDGAIVANAIIDYEQVVTHVTQLDVHVHDWGRLDLVGDFTSGARNPSWFPPLEQFTHLDISWRDAGLVPRLLSNAAVKQGMDPDAYVALLSRSLAPAGASANGAGVQLAHYLNDPSAGPLSATLAPSTALPVSSLLELKVLPFHPEIAGKFGLSLQAPVGANSRPLPDTEPDDPNMTTDEPVDPEVFAPADPPASPAGTEH
ncbi:3-demethylubiquinone-9 3-methyltransferase [Acetobacter estunensis]|uniref:3-demethylubiquinone-9 3-methyltransferase n=1 Tax=Acetobacter estunensis TaxID=104097 RepID=UPI001C2DA1A5|nr:3-demethylubiquinone-9 3-methyltransferase [Acetobacter estunensis]MBV1838302.1 3-demethylubiquinone-9 3-methyltransferase [Acetobacter estunensis]